MCIINQLIKIGVDRKSNTKQVPRGRVGGIKGDIQIYTYIFYKLRTEHTLFYLKKIIPDLLFLNIDQLYLLFYLLSMNPYLELQFADL